MNRRWVINRTNQEFISYLSRASLISPVMAQILVNRGVRTPSAVKDFLSPSLTGLSDPYDLPGVRQAVERIKAARLRGEKVLVHGDYDADGLTATAIMVSALGRLGLEAHPFIPSRMNHGYGFLRQGVDAAHDLGARLIVTVDCGVTSFDAAAYARQKGIDVIITDHHEPARKGELSGQSEDGVSEFAVPDCVAVVNPKLLQESSFSGLAGAGVAFKIVQALALDGDLPISAEDSLSMIDLAALGTLADVVPLTGENRIITTEGLLHIQTPLRPGIRALRDVSGTSGKEARAGLLSFTMVPRINAAGRMGDASDVLRLFLTEDESEAYCLGRWLDALNTDRQAVEEEVYQKARAMVGPSAGAAIVLAGAGWHAGVLGIVASRISEEFHRPAFILSVDEGIAKGSCRSIPAFDIREGLSRCSDVLISFGGHKQAAGLKLEARKVPLFSRMIEEEVARSVQEEALVPSLGIDADVSFSEITHSLVKELLTLEPHGAGNPEPLLGAKGLEVVGPKSVGRNHLKMRLRKRTHVVDAIGFDMWTLFEKSGAAVVDAVFTPGFNDWNGNRYLQLVLKAFRPGV